MPPSDLDLPIAPVPKRVLAASLDYLVVGIPALALLFSIAIVSFLFHSAPWWVFAVAMAGIIAIDYVYFAGLEVTSRGRTLGKMALGLVVLDRRGGPASTAALLIRNCVRAVDLIVGIPMMASDPRARRLGDRLAGTVVTRARPMKKI